MKLLGKDISAEKIISYVGERLAERGLLSSLAEVVSSVPVEPPIDAHQFNLHALAEHADSTRALPIETHRGGPAGEAVVKAKQLFRRFGQVFINEALARQTVFNGHVRDSYAQLAAEVVQLRGQVQQLEGELRQARGAQNVDSGKLNVVPGVPARKTKKPKA